MAQMKVINWHKDTYRENLGRETNFDLMTGDVTYDDGATQKIYVTRATMKVMVFEQEHLNKFMSQKDFETYKDLIRGVAEVDRSYEED